jgi:hypothetical protein
MTDIKQELLAMQVGEFKDIIFSNGILRTTKELIRNSETEWEVNSFTEGWLTAHLSLEEAVRYCTGQPIQLQWT